MVSQEINNMILGYHDAIPGGLQARLASKSHDSGLTVSIVAPPSQQNRFMLLNLTHIKVTKQTI